MPTPTAVSVNRGVHALERIAAALRSPRMAHPKSCPRSARDGIARALDAFETRAKQNVQRRASIDFLP